MRSCTNHFIIIFPSDSLSSPFLFTTPPICYLDNSDPGTHSRLVSPLTTTVRALFWLREDVSAFFSRRRASNCAHSRYFFKISARSNYWSVFFRKYSRNLTMEGFWLMNQLYHSSSRGLPSDHRADQGIPVCDIKSLIYLINELAITIFPVSPVFFSELDGWLNASRSRDSIGYI